MNPSNHFKRTIEAYLEQRAASDTLFAPVLAKTSKNIDDCVTYILNTVKNSGINGFTDDEVFSMAVHYYDEDDIATGQPLNCKVVVNHTIQLTDEEKQQAHEDAIRRAQNEVYAKLTKPKSSTKKPATDNQQSLF